MEKEKQLSLCIITKNEEAFFPGCLHDMEEVADEMLVIDLGSDDNTMELARQAGAAVYQVQWEDDFSKVKNFCMEHATGKWVLFLRANETIPREQQKELRLLLKNPNAEGYLIHGEDGRKRSEFSPTQLLRLLRNRKNYRFRYRSFAYIPEEELYALQNSSLRIMRRQGETAEWQDEEMSRLLQKDLEEYPQDGYIRYLNGVALLNQKKYKESAASLERARQAFSGGYLYVPHLYQCLATCLSSLGRDEEAEETLSVGLWLFPFDTDLLVLRAKLYHQHDRDGEAIKDLETCLALCNRPNAHVPEPEVDSSVMEEMLENIRAGLGGRR